MKMTFWLLCGAFLAANLSAQQVTNAAAVPAGASTKAPGSTNNAAKPAGKAPGKAKASTIARKPAARPAGDLKTTPLKPGAALVVASNVNVRGQARLTGEVLTRLTKGQQVTVLEEIILTKSEPDEPSAWAKIALPAGAKVWVNALFIDPTEKTVKPNRLNLRGGPGENYSVIGRIDKGVKVKDLQVQGDWMEIEPPAGAYAFVAAQYLSQQGSPAVDVAAHEPAAGPGSSAPVTIPTPGTTAKPPETVEAPVSTPATNEPPPVQATVTEPTPIAKSTVDSPVTRTETPPQVATGTETSATVTPGTAATLGTNAAAVTEPEPEEPLPPRVVAREGVVRGSVSVQAPSHYELYSPESKRIINYLYNPSPDLDLSRYKGLRIIVTGEEGLDERWRNTPLLTIQKIQVLE